MNNQLSVLSTNNIDITKPEAFAEFVAKAKEIQGQLDAAWGFVEQQMLDHNVTKLQGDWGNISEVEKINWKTTKDVDPYYLKTAPDTKKLKAAFDAGELPEGADFTTTKYMRKTIKK